jgi:Transglutaminase-like superfamily
MKLLHAFTFALVLAIPSTARSGDPDTDGDGLPDFQEIHKYGTDPAKKDTAGKGTPDGDSQQRREFTYSIRAVVRVMPPYNLKELNDDYQDVRVISETKEYAELEVIVYPLNTNANAIKGNPTWKKDYAGMKEYLKPGVTTNWDEAMRKDLLRELAKDGIDTDKLTDKEVVEQVSRWLFKRSKFRNMFCTFYVEFRDGKPQVVSGLDKQFEKDRGDKSWSAEEQFDHELFGRQMFANKTHGTCTSTAVLQTTVLRALGIPTRIILCIPVADGNDPAQLQLVEKGLTHHRMRRDIGFGVSASQGFTSHTFLEVFVDGRWRRLNYNTLGQNVVDRSYLGLMIHVHTFNDLSEANLAATWGTRFAKGQRDEVFKFSNPYRLMEVSDHFGKYAKIANPRPGELTTVTIGKAYWAGSKDSPAALPDSYRTAPSDGSGRLFLHANEWLEDGDGYLQYKVFLSKADQEFVLKAKDQPDVKIRLSGPYLTDTAHNLCELEVIIPKEEFAKLAKGVAYTLHPRNGHKGYDWRVADKLTVTRE